MGNVMKRGPGGAQPAPQQGAVYSPYQQQAVVQQQPMVQAQTGVPGQPGMQQAPMYMQPPQQAAYVQQPQYAAQQPQYAPQQPQYAPQQPAAQYRPAVAGYPQVQQQAPAYRPSFPGGPFMPRYNSPSTFSLPHGQNQSSYENDAFLSNLTGWSTQDIERLRHEFLSYTNNNGVIDREGFRKLYVASLLNMTWEALERDAEAAFRNFDINQTGVLDFNEYITACSRMSRETNPSYGSSAMPPQGSTGPQMSPSYTYWVSCPLFSLYSSVFFSFAR